MKKETFAKSFLEGVNAPSGPDGATSCLRSASEFFWYVLFSVAFIGGGILLAVWLRSIGEESMSDIRRREETYRHGNETLEKSEAFQNLRRQAAEKYGLRL